MENFRKFLKNFENFLIKNFRKKKKNFDKKIEKNVKKKFLKILTCYIPFCSEFNSEQNEVYKHQREPTFKLNGVEHFYKNRICDTRITHLT